MRRAELIMFVFALLLISSGAAAEKVVIVKDAWVLAAPPNARVIAAYLIIKNVSNENVVLERVTGNRFQRIEMHRTIQEGDIMRMVPQKDLVIPAGASVRLEPRGSHLMLIGPDSVPKEGEIIVLTLHFDNGNTLDVKATVRNAGYYKQRSKK